MSGKIKAGCTVLDHMTGRVHVVHRVEGPAVSVFGRTSKLVQLVGRTMDFEGPMPLEHESRYRRLNWWNREWWQSMPLSPEW